ncbi:hypothetical protein C6500_02035 [Candidatus Poribacteria bacterium]|nr:MAG: hypothetical protein C6500_02035 [Candidatus Poribacteria bacterium]
MKVKTVELVGFKRFDHLTIDLGDTPKKIVAMVGPNGCGKSSIFDAFEQQLKTFRSNGSESENFYSKGLFYTDNPENEQYKQRAVAITPHSGTLNRKSFYIRTSYRFTPKINVTRIEQTPDILDAGDEPISTIALDRRLESNYKRLLGIAYEEFDKGKRTGDQVRAELIGEINNILFNILDIQISSLGNLSAGKGEFYFKKGNTIDFPYANLSSGEKETVDIVIDLIVKSKEYTETVYCIDEPELHLSTAIQRKLLVEINKLIPDNCQLWVATHSIGFIRALQNELKEDCQILDFSEKDYFTGTQTIKPIVPNRQNWMRIFETALDDLTDLVAPNRIVYCEGRAESGPNRIEKGLDAQVYENIFSSTFVDTVFVSSGGQTELDQRSDIAIDILGKVFKGVEIWVLKDRDMASGKPLDESGRQTYLDNNDFYHRVLKRWELENYLFDKEILLKYCESASLTFDEAAYDKFVRDINNQNVKDEVGRIKNFCGITTNISVDKFKLNLSKCITKETSVYEELRKCIFERA